MHLTGKSRPIASRFTQLLSVAGGLLLAAGALSGCVAGGDGVSALRPDRTFVTGTIPPRPDSDETAVVSAVAAATPEAARTAGIPWANADSGTAGVISAIRESSKAGMTCRTFETSRQSYDGIALYVGKACEQPGGAWQGVFFRPKHPSEIASNSAATPTG